MESNDQIKHLDISHDGFVIEDVKVIAEGLKNNHSLLGIHMIGNEAEIDALGFAKPVKSNKMAESHAMTRIAPDLVQG